MKELLFIFFLLCFSFRLCAQQTTFQEVIGSNSGTESNVSVQQTTDGGFIIAGPTFGSLYGYGVFLVKTNSDGDTLWTKIIDQGSNSAFTYCIKQTADGGYAITGATNSFTGNYKLDMFLLKTDSFGNFEWEKTYAAPYNSWGYSLRQTTDNGYILSGQASFDSINQNVFLVKTDVNGDTLWTRNFGGTYFKYGWDVCQTSDHGFIVVGSNNNTSSSGRDILLIKTDSTGNLLWSKTYGGPSTDLGYSIQLTSDGGYILVGSTNCFGVIGSDVLLIKTDNNGVVIFAKTFGASTGDNGYSVSTTSDGGYFICGSTLQTTNVSDSYAIRTDSAGNLIWSKKYGYTTDDYMLSGQQTTDGGFILAGTIFNYAFGVANYIIKTDENGATGCFWEQNLVTVVGSPSVTTSTPVTIVGSGAIVNSIADSLIHTTSNGSFLPMCFTAAIPELTAAFLPITISPNPFTSLTTITFSEEQKNTSLTVTDVLGNSILQSTINSKQSTIDMSGYAKGMYFVEVKSEQGIVNKKIIKE